MNIYEESHDDEKIGTITVHTNCGYNTIKSIFMGKSDEEIADEVIAGKWSNGYNRIYQLSAAGYDYKIIQNIVNSKLAQVRHNMITKIIFQQKKACIVFWADGTKTVVKRKETDKFDKYSAVAQAIAKHLYGSTSTFHKMVDSVAVSHVMTKLKD